MNHGSWPRSRWGVAAVVALMATAGLAGCGDTGSFSVPDSASTQDGANVAGHDGDVCPRRLPQAQDDPSRGFGTDQPAEKAPTLAEPDAAWVCRYDPRTGVPGPDAEGMLVEWVRHGNARPVDAGRLPVLTAAVRGLEPIRSERACTDDLGPRWMLAFADDNDLTGVVVDDFGCDDVRLTHDPFEIPPGDTSGAGTVSGVLMAHSNLLQGIRAAYGR